MSTNATLEKADFVFTGKNGFFWKISDYYFMIKSIHSVL